MRQGSPYRPITCMPNVVGALCWGEAVKECANAFPCLLNRSFAGFAQQCLQFGEDLFDRI
jgi:hypothetical protein